MFHREDDFHRNARDVRANLSVLCHALHATTVLNQNHPVAILVPITPSGYDRYTTKDKRIAAAKKLFAQAIRRLRTPT